MLIVSGFVLAAKFVAAVKEVAVAWRYGVSGEVDAYLLALTVVTWIPAVLWSIGTYVVVPRLVKMRTSEAETAHFVSELNGIAVVLAAMATVIVVLVGPSATGIMAHGLAPETRALAASLTLQLAPSVALFLFCSYFSVRLQSTESFAYTSLEALPAVGIMLALLVMPTTLAGPLMWGTLAGFAAQFLVLSVMVRNGPVGLGQVSFSFRSAGWSGFGRALLMVGLSQFTLALTGPVDQYFASFAGDGAIATLSFANRLLGLITTLGGIVIARVLLPVLSESILTSVRLARRQALQWCALLVVLGAMATVVGFVVSPWLVELLFHHGAFTASDTSAVVRSFRYGALQFPFFFGNGVLLAWIMARQYSPVYLYGSALGLLGKILITPFLFGGFGVDAIQIGTAAFHAISFCVFLVILVTDSSRTNVR